MRCSEGWLCQGIGIWPKCDVTQKPNECSHTVYISGKLAYQHVQNTTFEQFSATSLFRLTGWFHIHLFLYLSKIWYRFHSKIDNVLLTIKVESDGSVAFAACVFGGNFVIPSILCGHSGNLQSDVISCALWAWDKFIFSWKKQRKKHEQKIKSYHRFVLSWNKWEKNSLGNAYQCRKWVTP